jgi:hypothetical protein
VDGNTATGSGFDLWKRGLKRPKRGRRIPRKTLHKRVFLSILRHIIVNSASSSTNQGSCLWRRFTFTPKGRLFIDITARHTAEERGTHHLTALGASTRGYSQPNAYQEHDFATEVPTRCSQGKAQK